MHPDTQQQINDYIASLAEPKRNDLQALHLLISQAWPDAQRWFLDGKNSEGKVVSNPNIGYGEQNIEYADGKTRPFYRVGISANTSGISVYIMSIKDKTYLPDTYGKNIGKAKVSGYCISFKSLKDINIEVLKAAIGDGLEGKS
ncbi:MAG: DUF1801 domain-containing protein [Saprospiraceae bacterium]|nr:DUF1801 domain-containing protein [Saprospiraceae bacterium]